MPSDPQDEVAEAQTPGSADDRGLAGLVGPVNVRSAALTGVFLITACAALSLARTLLLPLVLALIAQFAFTPFVRSLRRVGIPSSLGSLLVLSVVLGVGAAAVSFGSEPAREWLVRLPDDLGELREQLQTVQEPIAEVVEATEEVARMADAPATRREPVTVRDDPLLSRVLTQTGNVVVTGTVVLVLLYFLLASGDSFLRKIVTILPRFAEKRRAAELVRRVESDVSRYLVSVALINTGLGVVLTLALLAIGMPQAPLWGALAALLNFVPFLGAVAMACILALAAATALPSLAHVALVVATSSALSALEGLVITPAIVGHRMTLSPFAVLVSVLLWSWLWGIPGGFVAVPILVVVKAVVDAFPQLRPVGILLERDLPEGRISLAKPQEQVG